MKYDTLVLDYESYWSNDYSLSKMNTIRYVRDPRFKAHGAALKLNSAPAEWVTGSHLKSVLQNDIDWSKTLLIGHNLPFDGLILSEHYECYPHTYVDTLGMARCVLGGTVPSRSLDAVAQHYGHVGKLEKGGALYATKGVRDLSPEQERTLAAYACQDAEQTALIFRSMWPEFPKKMLATLDWTVRMMTQPGIQLNADVMRECHETEVEIKRNAVANCRITKTQLNSNKQFADILREHGIEPPTKISRTTGKETYAFSKTDQEFVDLQDDPNTDVRDLVLARLAVKSSIEETRSKAYLELAEDGKLMPVPLAFCGAMQTGRLSGTEGLNCFTGDHELLTPNGWQRIDEWDAGTPVMQWERNGSMSFVLAERKIEKPHDGYCVAIEGRTVSAFVTPEHRFAHVKFKTSADRVAQDLLDGRRIDVPLRGEYAGAGAMTADQARFMVALAADGSKQKRRWSFGFRRDRKIARMRELLSRLGAEYRETDKDAQGTTHFYVDSRTVSFASKGYGAWVLSLDAEAADAALDEVRHWDGFANSNNGATQFCSQFEDQAVWVCTLARLRGISATISSYARPTSTGRMHFVYFGSSKASTLSKANAERVPYAGTVYCLTVPSSYVFVKRGTKMFVTGQCQNLGRQSRIRDGMEAPDGYVFVEADSSNIELRVVAKFCGQNDLVETLRVGGDAYSDFATTLFGVPVTKALTKTDPIVANYRQTGKVSMLACLAEGTEVLTLSGLKGIEHVTTDDLLWDGVEWVRHDGVVFNGVRPVIQHDGLTATPDHRVFLEDGREVDFVAAAIAKARLARTGAGEQPLGLPDCFVDHSAARRGAARGERAVLLAGMRSGVVGEFRELPRREDDALQGVRAPQGIGGLGPFTEAHERGAGALSKPDYAELSQVRREGHRVPVSERRRGGELDRAEPSELAERGSRPGEQRRSLRAGEPARVHTQGERREPREHRTGAVDGCTYPSQRMEGEPLRAVTYRDEVRSAGNDGRADHRASASSGSGEAEELARDCGEARVYDILNAGPRNRFTANGRLVHNCQYRVGARTFQKMLWVQAGLRIDEAEAERINTLYRNTYTGISGMWKRLDKQLQIMATGAVPPDLDPTHPIIWHSDSIELPSGFKLKYPDLRYVTDQQTGRKSLAFTFFGGKSNGLKYVHGGTLLENLGQSLAREIIDPQVQKIRRRYPVLLQVHDAVLALVPETEAEEGVAYVRECMSEAPSWWPGIPITCEAGYGKTYGGIKKS